MHRRIGFLAAGLTVALTAAGGTAFAAVSSIPDSNGVIHGCYNEDGNLKVIDTSETSNCPHRYTSLNWNSMGPQGPQGPAGPAGATGSQGPAGPAGVSGYKVVTKTDTAPAGGFVVDSVACPSGEVPTGGGELLTSSPVIGTVRLVQSAPTGIAWAVDVENLDSTLHGVTIYAVCINAS